MKRETDGVDAQRDLEKALDDLDAHGGEPKYVDYQGDEPAVGVEPLKNSFRDELEAEAAPPSAVANESAPRGRVLVRGGRRFGKLLGPDAAPLVQAPAPPRPERRPLRVGDFVRALGFVYRVRKVTPKDVVLRPARPEELK